MSLSELRGVINRLRDCTNNLSDSNLGTPYWRQDFTQMLYELDKTLKDMDGRIENIESEIE